MDTAERLQVLKSKIKDFAQAYKENLSRIHSLEKENTNLKAELENEQLRIAELEEKLKVSKLAVQVREGQSEDDTASKELKNKLNEYIKEIDKCVALLNN